MRNRKVKLTKQMANAIVLAEAECLRRNSQSILPVHLLIGCLEQDSFTVKEAIHHSGINVNAIRNTETPAEVQNSDSSHEHFNMPVSLDTKQVLEEAVGYMEGYNQIFLNEGHVLRALINSGYIEDYLTLEQKQYLLSNATVSRDMMVDLTEYSCSELKYQNIRKVRPADSEKLIQFVENEFSGRWTESIKLGLNKTKPSIFIATDPAGAIIGFAAYDVGNQEGCFGPMGVAMSNRSEGIGYTLLHQCLYEMKMQGYTKIIIGGAGPIEFYERSSSAKVIPVSQ
ncbi:Clp protease N-terminal domain-containing protein [Heyndrickxia sp. MSNUG]|uniref:GNAT family N-acetyltransferase n=1 Tax=Heyndrickxia sp. MSNUG TaxID=3136677 RepID=UPI003C300143